MAFKKLGDEIRTRNALLDLPHKLAGTGHRPDKLGGYDATRSNHHGIRLLMTHIEAHLNDPDTRPDLVISGGALGFDQYLGVAAIEAGIPLLLALPCDPWGDHWPETSLGSKIHRYLAKKATHVHYVTPAPYRLLGTRCLQVRNEWMVDNATDLLACWDGSSGGTANCLQYAFQVEEVRYLTIHQMWDPRYKQPVLQAA